MSAARIAFLGLGAMGLPMARNLAAKAPQGAEVVVFDVSARAREAAGDAGLRVAESVAEAATGAETLVLALPAAEHVSAALESALGALAPGALALDCSTIAPASARGFGAAAAARGHVYLDCPMSGGVGGAQAGTLTFMVGGPEAALERARPVLTAMGARVLHAGDLGAGAAAKLCNNLLLAVSMIGAAEALALGERLGLSAAKLHEIGSVSTGRCWSLVDYCPAPGPVPGAPSSNGYRPGFAVDLMAKDLRLALSAAAEVSAPTPLGAQAAQVYGLMRALGQGGRDFSAVFALLSGGLDALPPMTGERV